MPLDSSGSSTMQSYSLKPTTSEPPQAVYRAVTLLWMSLAIGAAVPLLSGSLLRLIQASATSALFGIVVYGASLGLAAAFIMGIARGRNWVRLLAAVLVPLGFVLTLAWPPLWLLSVNWRSAAFVISYVLQARAVWLTFMQDARPWFHRYRGHGIASL